MTDQSQSIELDKGPITVEQWPIFIEEYLQTASECDAYLGATEDITLKLDEIVSSAKDYDDLKKEITNFITDRKQFIQKVKHIAPKL